MPPKSKSKMTNTGMYQHLVSRHPMAEKERLHRDAATEAVLVEEQKARRARDESGILDIVVYGLRTKKLYTRS